MKKNNKIFLLALILGMLASAPVSADPLPLYEGGEIIASFNPQDDGLEFSLQVPWNKIEIQNVVEDDHDYASISIPEWENVMEPGFPALPFYATVVGVPFGADVSIAVQPGKSHTIQLESIPLPAGGLSLIEAPQFDPAGLDSTVQPEAIVEADPAIYQGPGVFQSALGAVTSDAVLREQRIVGINLFPVQYDPDQNQLVVYERLDVSIEFTGQNLSIDSVTPLESQAYASIFEDMLLNAEQAQVWRGSDAQQTAPSGSSESAEALSTTRALPWMPPEPGWRISLTQEGIYEIPFSALLAAGLPVETLDPATLQLFNLGEEIAIDFNGDVDEHFESGESIIFYAPKHDTKYSDQNVYWLTYGQSPGLRMATRDVTPGSAATPSYFINTLTMGDDNYYASSAPGDDDFERFMWGLVAANNSLPGQWSHTFEVTAPFDGSGEITIDLLGYIQRAANPDHHVRIYLENAALPKQQIAEFSWDGIAWQNPVIELPAGYLIDGENTIIVESVNDTGGVVDRVFVDQIEIQTPRLFSAQENQIKFRYDISGDWTFDIGGFTSLPQALFDITDPNHVVNLVNYAVSGSGPYAIQFQDNLTDPSDYFAWGQESIQSASSIVLDQTSQLASTENRVDYILITPDVFSTEAETLVDYRQSQGLDAIKVGLQDIYDEFNFGIPDANAIHDFLQYAYENWESPAPSYVVLLGDGHYDPKDHLGYGRTSFIPPFLAVVDPWIKETASDNRYVTVAGDDTVPDMMIGRLSVNSPAEAEAVINKTIGYETSSAIGGWQESILAIADNTDSGGNFPAYSESVLNESVPEAFSVNKVYYGQTHTTVASARTAILNAFNDGALIVNYIGHAYYTGWAYEDLFTTNNVPGLTNSTKLAVVLAMTCYEGYFHRPNPLGTNAEALAEVVTNAQGGGAVASFSPAGLGVASGHDVLNRGFYTAFFDNHAETIGEAVIHAKLVVWGTGSTLDLLDTYLLFGDPATRFIRPLQANFDQYQTDEDVLLNIDAGSGVMANDRFPEGPVPTVELVVDAAFGTLNLETYGAFSYDPDPDWFGTDQFSYRLVEGDSTSNVATVEIVVEPINDAPIAYSQTINTAYQTPVVIELTAGDVEGTALSYRIIEGQGPDHGSFGEMDLPFLTYTPDEGFVGTDHFEFIANDGDLDSLPGVITVIVGIVDRTVIYFPFFTK